MVDEAQDPHCDLSFANLARILNSTKEGVVCNMQNVMHWTTQGLQKNPRGKLDLLDVCVHLVKMSKGRHGTVNSREIEELKKEKMLVETQLKDLTLRTKTGELVDISVVSQQFAEIGSWCREKIENLCRNKSLTEQSLIEVFDDLNARIAEVTK